MSPVTRYSVIDAHLAVEGRATALKVLGDTIDAQYDLEDGSASLVLITAGLPWDDWLEVLLIDRHSHTLIDAVHAGAPFTTTMVTIKAIAETHLDLTYFNDQVYRIAIAPEPRYGGIQPVGWRYAQFALRHRLSVRQVVS